MTAGAQSHYLQSNNGSYTFTMVLWWFCLYAVEPFCDPPSDKTLCSFISGDSARQTQYPPPPITVILIILPSSQKVLINTNFLQFSAS